MSDFFKQFEKEQPKVEEVEVEVKEYPDWVLQTKSPDKTMVMFDVVIDLYEKAKDKIKRRDYDHTREVTLSNAQVIKSTSFLESRSALKNHAGIVAWIKLKNENLAKRLLDAKAKGKGVSTARKTKDTLKIELEEYKGKHEAKTKIEMENLIQSEMLVSHADSIRVNAEQKQTINELHKKIAEIKHANKSLQEDVRTLQEKLFKAQKPPTLKVKK
jgi:hypothetical protein